MYISFLNFIEFHLLSRVSGRGAQLADSKRPNYVPVTRN